MKTIETLTLTEAMDMMRNYGLPMSYKKLTAWLDAGVVPWAVSAPDSEGQPQRTIFKKPLIEWLVSLSVDINRVPSKSPDLTLADRAVRTQ